MSQNLNVLCVSLGSNCFCIISYLLATKWSQFGVPSHGQLAVSGTVTLSCRAWSREGSQGLALVKSQLRAGCAWLCCQSHLAPGWDKARPWPLLAVLQCGERGVCIPPPLVSPAWPFLRLRHCSKPLHQHYPEPSPDQAQPVTATSSHWQHQPSSSQSRDTRLCFDCRILLSLLGIFWFEEITLYCPGVKDWTSLVIGTVCCKSNKNISDEVESGIDWL